MAIKNSSDITTHKWALAMFLAALIVATVFGIMGTAAGTPHDSKVLVTNPVIFVHGYFGSSDDMLYPWTNMTQALDNASFVKGINYFIL
jgi:pimeloyl-ACP methyl ester carboxylesterase